MTHTHTRESRAVFCLSRIRKNRTLTVTKQEKFLASADSEVDCQKRVVDHDVPWNRHHFSKILVLMCILILNVFQNLPPHCQSECEEDGHIVDGHREVDVEEHEESPEY